MIFREQVNACYEYISGESGLAETHKDLQLADCGLLTLSGRG